MHNVTSRFRKLAPPEKLNGFTLTEAILVVLFIGILSAIAIPKFNQAVISRYKAEVEANFKAESIKNRVFSFLNENLKSVKALSGLKELQNVLSTSTEERLAKANFILDHFQVALDASVCYVMNRQGLTLASSNRNAPNSFVGKNYSFRPYFQQAIHGDPHVYMALGVTSKKRGAYYSHPIYKKGQKNPIGVVVVKAPVEHLEEELDALQRHAHGENILIADPHGIVFISSHKEWRYQSL